MNIQCKSLYKLNDFENIKFLDKGNFAEVLIGEHQEKKGFKVAIKECLLTQSEKHKKGLERKLDALINLNHPNIYQFYGYGIKERGNKQYLYIYLQYCNEEIYKKH